MITSRQLDEAIRELEARPNPNASTCEKLANLYVLRDHIDQPKQSRYSFARGPKSDFLALVDQVDTMAAWDIMDELMDTLQTVNRRVYDGVMRRLDNLR